MGGVNKDNKPEKLVPRSVQFSRLLSLRPERWIRSLLSHRANAETFLAAFLHAGDHFKSCFYLSGESLFNRRRVGAESPGLRDGCCGGRRTGEPAGEEQPHGVHRQ